MIKLNTDEDTNPRQFHGTMVRGIGRIVWARNWKGDWVRQVMHQVHAPVGQDDDIQRARFVDKVLKRMGRAK